MRILVALLTCLSVVCGQGIGIDDLVNLKKAGFTEVDSPASERVGSAIASSLASAVSTGDVMEIIGSSPCATGLFSHSISARRF